MPTQYNKVLKTDYDSVITAINNARTRWGLGTFSDTNIVVDRVIFASTIQNFQTKLQEAKTASGAPTDISGLTATPGSTLITAQLLNDFVTKATEIQNYCSCNCNYCTCNCQYCTCNCQYCTCDCQYCTCNCQYSCTCNCQYCTCDCQYCTCNCQYSCTCNCQYSCTCNCNYCSCNCNDCFCYCAGPGPIS